MTGKQEIRKCVTGYVFTLASGAVSLAEHRQSIVAIITSEAEYVASAEALMKVIGLKNMVTEALQNVRVKAKKSIDNRAASALSIDPTYSKCTRHIKLKYNFVLDLIKKGQITIGESPRYDLRMH